VVIPKPMQETQERLVRILERMAQKATEKGLKGVAVAGVLDGRKDFVSRTRNCGKVFEPKLNFFGLAYTKVAEMCETLLPSGSKVRPPYAGETGYVGGTLKQAGDVHYLAAFSGGAGEEDLEIAKFGLEIE